MKKFLIMALCLSFALSAYGCKKGGGGSSEPDSSGPQDDPYALEIPDEDFSYYHDLAFNKERKLKVFDAAGLSDVERFLAQGIQGLFAQTEVTYFMTDPARGYLTKWLNDILDNYDVTREDTTLPEMVAAYLEKWGDDAGYILLDRTNNPQSVNVATSVAGVTGWVPLDVSIKDKYESMGLKQKLDVTDKDDRWAFETYKDEYCNDGLFQLTYGGLGNSSRDYPIACKYFCFYQDGLDPRMLALRGDVQTWTEDDSPVFGWGPIDEMSHVQISSENGQFTLASDWHANLTVYSCPSFYGINKLVQKNHAPEIEAENKHYVCVVCSDGDNIQALHNTLANGTQYYLAERADFPMGWNISPSAIDVQPTVQKWIYENTGDKDYFVAAVSGQGYMNPSVYPFLSKFCGRLTRYLERGDLNTLQILDSRVDKTAMEYYSRVPGLLGVQYMVGNYYSADHGSIYWSENGMPFVTCRLSLWEPETGKSIAGKINSYPVNPHSIEGYTLVNLHPWSRTYQDVVEMYNNLDDDVEIVTAEQFFKLIIKNVPHEDVKLTD